MRIKLILIFLFACHCVLTAGLQPSVSAMLGNPTWTAIGPEGGYILGIAANPQNTNILLAVSYYYPGQVFKSTDAGLTWQKITSLDGYLYDVVFDPQNGNIVYILGSGGIYKSTDGAQTWTSYRFGDYRYVSQFSKINICAQNPNVLYVGGYYYHDTVNWNYGMAVFKSTNAGESWTTYSPETSSTYGQTYGAAVDPSNPDIVYIGGYSYNGANYSYRLWKSSNGGTTWTDIIGSIQGYVYDIIIDPANPKKIFAGNYSGIWRSPDGGQSWQKNSGYACAYQLILDPSNSNTIYAGYSKALYKSTDAGISWTSYSSGLYGSCYALLAVSISSASDSSRAAVNTLFYGSNAGIYRSSDGGQNWTSSHSGVKAGEVPAVDVAPSSPSVVYAEMSGNGFFKSTNAGQSWNRLPDFYRCEAINRIFVNPNNANDVFILAGG